MRELEISPITTHKLSHRSGQFAVAGRRDCVFGQLWIPAFKISFSVIYSSRQLRPPDILPLVSFHIIQQVCLKQTFSITVKTSWKLPTREIFQQPLCSDQSTKSSLVWSTTCFSTLIFFDTDFLATAGCWLPPAGSPPPQHWKISEPPSRPPCRRSSSVPRELRHAGLRRLLRG